MPWKEVDKVKSKREFVEDVLRGERSFAQICRNHGISRPTGYAAVRRFRETGELSELSRRPRSHPKAVPAEIVQMVIALKRTHPDLGPQKISSMLRAEHPNKRIPAPSTVAKYLAREGLCKRRRRRQLKAGKRITDLVDAKHANHVWAADFKGSFRLDNGLSCHPLTITDTYSRFLLGCTALYTQRLVETQRVFERVFKRYGLPARIRTDNGTPFRGTAAPAGVSRLVVWWLKLGIWPERITPGHPEQNGRHERMHRTLKEVAIDRNSRRSLRSQQHRFDRFRRYYNETRPHAALGQTPPAIHHRPGPGYRPPIAPNYADVDTRKVKRGGGIRWLGREVQISQVLAGERVGLVPLSEGRFRVYFATLGLGVLDDQRTFTPYE